MINAVRDYDDSYSYSSVEHKRKVNQLNKFRKIMGSILLLLSFFVLYMLPDQSGNWTLTAYMLILSAALFYIGRNKSEV
jgi:hypothetical protein